MTAPSTPNEADLPEQSVVSPQDNQPQTTPPSAGNALLDAQIAATEQTQPKGEPLDEPIATNFGGAGGKGDPTLSNTIDTPTEPEIEKY